MMDVEWTAHHATPEEARRQRLAPTVDKHLAVDSSLFHTAGREVERSIAVIAPRSPSHPQARASQRTSELLVPASYSVLFDRTIAAFDTVCQRSPTA